MKVKLWVGVSDINARRPDDSKTFEVRDDDDLNDAIEQITDYIIKEYNGYWEIEDEDDTDSEGS